jgi:flagellar basal-body rod protein FlgF
MDTTAYIALSRAVALDRQMTSVANNIANVTTSGYRAERLHFEQVLERAGEPGRVAFVQDRGPVRDASPAPLMETGNPLDLAISGDGYFTVETPQGPRYSRAGHFAVDAQQRIATRDGHALLDENGAVIEVPVGSGPISVAADGTLGTAAGPLARVVPVELPDQALSREGSGLYAASAAPVPAERFAIHQGAVLGSNVQPVLEMTRMIDVQRAFESSIRMIEMHHDLVRRSVERTASLSA